MNKRAFFFNHSLSRHLDISLKILAKYFFLRIFISLIFVGENMRKFWSLQERQGLLALSLLGQVYQQHNYLHKSQLTDDLIIDFADCS